MEKKIAMRPDSETYLNLGKYEAPVWARCGDGWSKLDESPNAETEDTHYINAASATTTVVGYKPQYAFEVDLMYTDPTIKSIYDVANERKIGAEAVKDFLFVDKFTPGTSEGSYFARREQLAVAVNTKGGTKKMTLSGNLNAQGDPVYGEFTPVTKVEEGQSAGTFTAATETAEATTTGTESQTEGEETTPTGEDETTT